MIDSLKILAAQINPIVGDLSGNANKIQAIWDDNDLDCDLIVFPEMCFTGYPLEDLVLRPAFIEDVRKALEAFCIQNKDKQSAILIGAPIVKDEVLFNAGILIEKGVMRFVLKHDLPNYGVFDEVRIFAKGPLPDVTEFRGHKLGIMICWDFWSPEVAAHLKAQGAEYLIVPNGSTYENTKYARRLIEARKRTAETGLPLLYMNLVGGHDELVFDGASFMMSAKGEIACQLKAFEEDVQMAAMQSPVIDYPDEDVSIYMACILGLRDYVHKSGFQDVLLGLSGGIDSALTAVMAVDALGREHVHAVLLPSTFTSDESNHDALTLIDNLNISHAVIPIKYAMTAYEGMITGLKGLAHENMQARVRGAVLMSLSNQSGALLLSTGNKSEIAVGYSTLYGDMCGAFNPLKDLYKTRVYALSRLRNHYKPSIAMGQSGLLIPENIITRAPSAELRENQTDQDSLPPYDVLDQILTLMIEGEVSVDDITQCGFEREMVSHIYKLLHRAEYKRRQSCPGVNITTKSFGGRSRRYPIVNRY